MTHREPEDIEQLRLRVVLAFMLALLLVLGAALFHRQAMRGTLYEQSLRTQSLRTVRLPPVRGRIVDRNGVCLADSRPAPCLALYLEELRRPGRGQQRTIDAATNVLDRLGRVLGRAPEVGADALKRHVRTRLPLAMPVFRNLSDADLARLVESEAVLAQAQGRDDGEPDGERLPLAMGVDLAVEWVRHYPSNQLAAHLVGYVGRSDPAQSTNSEPFDYALAEWCGRTGVERRLDPELRGEPGHEVVRIDAAGYRFVRDRLAGPEARAEWRREPVAGRDVRLAVDVRVQAAAEAALEGATGAVVVLNPANGDVLALASRPTFDPNQFVPVLRADDWAALRGHPNRPLLNRAVAGVYAPGSVFKPVVSLAALEGGSATERTPFDCPGYYERGPFRLRCWLPVPGHGRIAMGKALEQSCNSYFAALGVQCGYGAVEEMARRVGLGRKTGIELDEEAPGLVPSPEWKRRRLHDDWRFGDTCNVSIGQGAVAVTPLQMALLAAAIANGGDLYRPRLVLGTRPPGAAEWLERPPERVAAMGWTAESLRVVRRGMYDVVMAPSGTGARARVPGVEMAGKTGTAEYGSKEAGRKHAWMIAYAPFDPPRYAIAMVLDDAESGGRSVAPRLRELVAALFGVAEGGAG
jgi:penicillin-binding protein 2